MRISFKALALAAAATFAAVAPSAAGATSFNVANVGLASGVNANVYFPGLGNGSGMEGAGAGLIYLNSADAPGGQFLTYCVDIFDWLAGNTPFTETPMMSMSTIAVPHSYSTARLNTMMRFLTNADALVHDNVTAAAAQLGIWEILNEDTNAGYNVKTGMFHVTDWTYQPGSLAGSDTLANTWLSNLSTTWSAPAAGKGVMLLAPSPGNQPQVYVAARGFRGLAVAEVPEPASWMTMILGFGAIGWAMRRRRTVGRAVA